MTSFYWLLDEALHAALPPALSERLLQSGVRASANAA